MHSFIQSSIHLWVHSLHFLGETSKVGNNTPLCPRTSKYYTTLILAGDLRNQMQCRTLVCLKIGYPKSTGLWSLSTSPSYHQTCHSGKMPHVQTPVIIILVISIHDIRMIIPMIAGQILIGIHNIIIFNIILMIVPVVLIIIPFIISSLSTLILFTNWHWYCFSRCKNIDLTYIPINILTELYTVNHCSIILRYHNYWTKVPNYIYNCTYIYIPVIHNIKLYSWSIPLIISWSKSFSPSFTGIPGSKNICRAAGPPAAPNLPMGWIPRLSSRARRTAWGSRQSFAPYGLRKGLSWNNGIMMGYNWIRMEWYNDTGKNGIRTGRWLGV